MHRSGTSALTGVMTRLGAAEPNTPLPANEFNPRGYGESRIVMNLNDEILKSIGNGWSDLSEITPQQLKYLKSHEFEDKIVSVLTEEYLRKKNPAIKDPRICRIAKLWTSALRRKNIFLPKYLISIRHPMEVAKSLHHRNRINLDRGLALWLRYNLDIEFQTRDQIRCFVGYDKLLKNCIRESSRVVKKLSLHDFEITPNVLENIQSFLSVDLKHHDTKEERAEFNSDLSEMSSDVFEIFREVTGDNLISETNKRRLDKVRQNLNFSGRVYSPLLSQTEEYARNLQKALNLLKSEVGSPPPQQLATKTNLRMVNEKHSMQMSSAIEKLEKLLKSSNQKNGYLEQQLIDANENRALLGAASQDLSEKLLEELEARSTNHEKLRETTSKQIEELSKELEARSTKHDKLRERTSARIEELSKEIDFQVAKYEELREKTLTKNELLEDQLFEAKLHLEQVSVKNRTYSANSSLKAKNLYLLEEIQRLSTVNSDLSERNRLLSRKVSEVPDIHIKNKPRIEASISVSDTVVEDTPKKLKLNKQQLTVLRSAFEVSYYKLQCKGLDVSAVTDWFNHYVEVGASLDLSPHPLFDPVWYKKRYDDLGGLEQTAYLHYLMHGVNEGRFPCPLFDTGFYMDQNPDIAANQVFPHVHYYQKGWLEGRNPSAWFYTNWYKKEYFSVQTDGTCPLTHYMKIGESLGYFPHPSFDPLWYRAHHFTSNNTESSLGDYLEIGRQRYLPTNPVSAEYSNTKRPTLLVVSHSASGHLYGSERSFIDVLSNIDQSRYRVVACLPEPDHKYVSLVSKYVDSVHFTKRVWWENAKGLNEAMLSQYKELIEFEHVDAIYVNTIMLREPVEAAKRAKIPSICHIREAITYDPDLTNLIGMPAENIIAKVLERSDYVIGNSKETLRIFGNPERSFLIYNAVKIADFDFPRSARLDKKLRFGILSSNIPKKGIADVIDLAALSASSGLNAEFHIIGPETEETERLRSVVKRKKLKNVSFRGYISSAAEAMQSIDVVLNFSHFAESFGRTIAEAAAAGLPSIVYEHGALPEVVEHGKTGYVIPYRKPEEALGYVKSFFQSSELLNKMGEAAKQRAINLFSHQGMRKNVNQMFDAILESNPRYILDGSNSRPDAVSHPSSQFLNLAMSTDADSKRAPVSVVVPNYNYEEYIEERLLSILQQTIKPAQIIFLDDASPDNSVTVARNILSNQDIPYQIITNDKNVGVYKQWIKGFNASTEEWVWIAEADDRCEPDFIEKLLKLADADTNIIYAESQRIDGDGKMTAADNRGHSKDVSAKRWQQNYKEIGVREVVDALCFRNTIPNASAALLKRSSLHDAEIILSGLQYTGDWKLYTHLLRTGNIAYCSESLNHFRRHKKSVTRVKGKSSDYLLELANIREFICRYFPIREQSIERMNWFLDRDYKIDGVKKNSTTPAVIQSLDKSYKLTIDRRSFGFITTNNGSYYGGSEMLWRETAIALRQKGHDVFVVIKKWKPRPDFFDEMNSAGITLLFKEEEGFEKLISHKPDLVVVSLGDQDEGIEFYPRLKDARIPYAIINQLTKEARFWRIRKEKTPAVKQGYEGAKKTFFTCWNNQRVMQSRLGVKLSNSDLHFNPYHIDRTLLPKWPSNKKTEIAIPSKLLFIHKGQDILTEFLGNKFWKKQNIIFNFFGIGPDEQNLKDLAKKNGITNFKFHGRVSDISDIWKSNHALLMPSRMEGLPIMLVSAMLSGRVPIVTDIGGHGEVIDNNRSGFIASNPEAKSVEDALMRAINERENWQEIGKRARRQILDFLPENPVVDFVDKLEKIA